jgi:acyl CoA:acetate/3-ketoacid CoA transferase beta subunit
VIGDYDRPKVRMPGGAGSPEVVQHYQRIVAYFGRHDKRTLVAKVDFRTGGRRPISAQARRERGLLTGPIRIVTPLAVMVKDEDDAPFRLETLHPGVDVEQVVDNTGFELDVPTDVGVTTVPRAEQLALLRDRIDPFGTIRFDFMDAQERKASVRRILQQEWDRALEGAAAPAA